jgi:hypothetical protein
MKIEIKNKTEIHLRELEAYFKSPGLFLDNYFYTIENQVDLEYYLLYNLKKKSIETCKISQEKEELLLDLEIIDNARLKMIENIQSFKNECLRKIYQHKYDIIFKFETENTIKNGKEFFKSSKFKNDQIHISDLINHNKLINEKLIKIKSTLLLNKCMIFLTSEDIPKYYLTLNSNIFGILLYIQDGYFDDDAIKFIK